MYWVLKWTCLDVSSWLIRNNVNMKIRHRFMRWKIDGKKLLSLRNGQIKFLVGKFGDEQLVEKLITLIDDMKTLKKQKEKEEEKQKQKQKQNKKKMKKKVHNKLF